MKLRGTEFPPIIAGSGAMGYNGEGYWYQTVLKFLGILDMKGLGLVSKTCTLDQNDGNLPYGNNFQPIELLPKCIKIDWIQGNVLNSVGLSNPGIRELIAVNTWLNVGSSYFISIMSLANTKKERLQEIQSIITRLKDMPTTTSYGLQINLSCPNTKHDPKELLLEASEMIKIAAQLGVPIMIKISVASAPIELLMELNEIQELDAICVSNTIPHGWIPGNIFTGMNVDWDNTFGEISPLKKIGGGGLSGAVIKPFVLKYIRVLRENGFTKHINGGGGIMCSSDVDAYKNAGAGSVSIASVAMTS